MILIKSDYNNEITNRILPNFLVALFLSNGPPIACCFIFSVSRTVSKNWKVKDYLEKLVPKTLLATYEATTVSITNLQSALVNF